MNEKMKKYDTLKNLYVIARASLGSPRKPVDKTWLTLRDIKRAGFTPADRKRQIGYVPRKPVSEDAQAVYLAGGTRAGEYYTLEPAYDSSRFCWRQYWRE